jgi:hypothetical protein
LSRILTRPLVFNVVVLPKALYSEGASTSRNFVFVVETGSYYVAQPGLELKILLSWPLECQNYRHVPPVLLAVFPDPLVF